MTADDLAPQSAMQYATQIQIQRLLSHVIVNFYNNAQPTEVTLA